MASKKPSYVVAAASVSTVQNGRRQFVSEGQHYRTDDPLVKNRPDLFISLTEYARRQGRTVETATAAPGEVRNVTPPEAE